MKKTLTRKRAVGTLKAYLSPSAEQEWQMPKKTARPSTDANLLPTSSHNRYDKLPEVAGSKHARVPPVIMEVVGTHLQTIDLIKSMTKSGNFTLRYTGRGNVSIQCATLELRATLMDGLKGRRAFHTFTADEDKTVKSVLRGLPEVPVEEIAADLERQGLSVVKVTAMNTKAETSSRLYLTQFSAETTVTSIRSIRYVCFTKATLEKYKRNKSHATQCFRCQQYGHAARNCQRDPRCVKCTGNHATSECTKKDRETPATCTGCSGSHPANYKDCPRRTEYLLQMKKRQQKPHTAVLTAPKPTFALEQSQFPALRPTKPAVKKPTIVPEATPIKTQQRPQARQSEKPSSEAMSTDELRRMLTILQEIRTKAGKCASKIEIALMMVEYLDDLF